MLKRVHSHMKVRKPALLQVGALSQAHRSKSLTQIDCLEGGPSDPGMARPDVAGGSPPWPAGSQGAPSVDLLSVPDDGTTRLTPTRPLRSTGRVSSQEFLSVAIEEEPGGTPQWEVVRAIKGVPLRDALQGVLERRGLDLSGVDVILEYSKRPANLSHEALKFVGAQLRIKAKDGGELGVTRADSTSSLSSWKTSRASSNAKERKVSGSQRGRRGAVSTEDLVNDAILVSGAGQDCKPGKSKASLGRRSGILLGSSKTDKEEMRALTELLNGYDQGGIPSFPGLLTFGTASNEHKFRLEDNWRSIVDDPDSFPKRVRNQQDAIWELISTEVSYLRTLKVITELFLACLCNLQSEGILQEVDTERMFSNITDVYQVNHALWDDCLLPALNAARARRGLLDPLLLRPGFLRFEEAFQPYIKYCLEHTQCSHYVKEKRAESDLFKTYVAWCEARKDCERLRFTDLLVKPMQRLTKYSLLLKAIHKKTDDEASKQALVEMNDCVESFVFAVDGRLRQRHELERLKSIISRIESYDPFDINNDEVEKALRPHCELDLTCPMPGCGHQQSRQLLYEASGIKMRDSMSSSKVDVHCFLFTDVLLVCKALGRRGDRVRVVRPPLAVDRLLAHELRDGSGLLLVQLGDLGLLAAYCLLYTPEPRALLEHLRRAQEQYREARAQLSCPQLGYLGDLGADEEDYDIPRGALLAAGRSSSPRSSSQSSLVHSHSGSVDMSDAAGPPVPCPTPLFGPSVPTGRATSFELGELRNPSMTVDDVDEQGRSRSMETRASPVCVLVTSPRPERRAFLLKGASPNTLAVCSHDEEAREHRSYPTSPVIQVPVVAPPPRGSRLAVGASSPTKPPLLKTKNVSGLVTHSAPPSGGPSPEGSREADSDDEAGQRVAVSAASAASRRAYRPERRHHTADSFEHLKNRRDPSIHKRLSWNLGQQQQQQSAEAPLRDRRVSKCLSSESVYSSSGVSSTGSLLLSSVGSSEEEGRRTLLLGREAVHLDVSEVRDGISSVQIVAADGGRAPGKPSRADLQRMKEFLLTSCSVEASEV